MKTGSCNKVGIYTFKSKSFFYIQLMIIRKFILILLLAFTLNLGVQSSRVLSNSSRHVIESIIEKNFTKDNEEFIKEVEKKRFSEMIKLYIQILEKNKRFKYFNTS